MITRRIIPLLLVVMLAFGADFYAAGQNRKKNKGKIEVKEAKPVKLTSSDFKKKVSNYDAAWKYLGNKPAIIDFYADWCGPCRMIAPIIDELAREYADEIYVYKVDTDVEQYLSMVYNIRSIPSIMIVPMEGPPHMLRGTRSKEELKRIIDDVLLDR